MLRSRPNRKHAPLARVYADRVTATGPASDREWWMSTLAVVTSPAAAFRALRDESQGAVESREEPILAVVLLAGIASVLATEASGRLLDDVRFDIVVIPVWAFIAGALYGLVAYFLGGAALRLGVRAVGGKARAPGRRARHVLGFALVPLALSLVIWPPRIALYGTDTFRSGGGDDGAGGAVFEALELGFAAWSLVLLLVGVRAVYGWPWLRAAVPAAAAGLAIAAVGFIPSAL